MSLENPTENQLVTTIFLDQEGNLICNPLTSEVSPENNAMDAIMDSCALNGHHLGVSHSGRLVTGIDDHRGHFHVNVVRDSTLESPNTSLVQCSMVGVTAIAVIECGSDQCLLCHPDHLPKRSDF